MSDFQKSITFTIMSAEVESLRSAIRAIGEEYDRGSRGGWIPESMLSVEAAIALLPENIEKGISMFPKANNPDQRKAKEAFSDVLG